MSIAFYKTLHFAGLAAFALYIGGAAWGQSRGGAGGGLRKAFMALHGAALLLLFVSGFGLLAKLKIAFPWPAWLFVKLAVWLALGAAPFFLKPGGGSLRILKIPRGRAAPWIMGILLLAAVFSALWKY